MAAARLAAVLSLVLAVALAAQDTLTSQVAITVIDQSGAVIPGAHIGIVQLPAVITNYGDLLQYAFTAPEQAPTRTNANGEVAVGLTKGSYVITIFANGFRRYVDRIEIRDEAGESLRFTLVIDQQYLRGDCMANCGPQIPLEPTSLNVFIPLEPLQTIALRARRVRRR
jgi:hypothetical protein